jgi:membrane protein DedA with SNARE-associated domain
MMEALFKYLGSLSDGIVYLLLGLSAYVENLFPPIPGDTITAFGAFLVGTGRLSFLGVYVSTTLGSLLGFLSLFWVGDLFGRRYFIEKDYRFLKADQIRRAEAWFSKYGPFLIAMNRFFPGIRSAIAVSAGISKLKPIRVGILALLSCAVWNLLWIWLGYVLGTHWETVEEKLSDIMARYNLAVLILFVLFLFALWVRKKRRHK